jgi:hypothetical protein
VELKQLIELGKVEIVYDVKGLGELHLTLPATNELKTGEDPLVMIAKHITRIGDQDCTTPEAKVELVEALKVAQPAVVARLAKICEETLDAQTQAVEGMFSKKA